MLKIVRISYTHVKLQSKTISKQLASAERSSRSSNSTHDFNIVSTEWHWEDKQKTRIRALQEVLAGFLVGR